MTSGAPAELRLGRWQDVLEDVAECDVILTDPPYSQRTHDGERGMRVRVLDPRYTRKAYQMNVAPANSIRYASISSEQVVEFVQAWAPRTRRWALAFGDHVSFRRWETAFLDVGWMTFAPVIWLKRNAPPRFGGDGPQSSCEHLCVARPRRRVRDHANRPGFYLVDVPVRPQDGGSTGVIGTKDIAGLMALLLDYTRPGDLVVDPFAGTATVGAACIRTGRRYIGSEMDAETHAMGLARLMATSPDPVSADRWREPRRQGMLFGV